MSTLHPPAELVARAWIEGTPGIPSGKVATTLPTERGDFPAGFVTVAAIPSTSQREVKKRESILDVVCWYPSKQGSNKPQWHKAAQLAEILFDIGYSDDILQIQRTLVLPGEYHNARVLAWMPGDPEKRGNDTAGNAAFGMNVEMHWIEVPK